MTIGGYSGYLGTRDPLWPIAGVGVGGSPVTGSRGTATKSAP